MVGGKFHKGMTALLFVAALTVAGARPAAAEGLDWREAWDWLSRLWSGVTLQHQSSADTVGPEGDPTGGATTNGDCGYEIDPSGKPVCKPTGAASGS